MKGFIHEPARARFALVCFSLAALLTLGLHGLGFAQAHASSESPEADAAVVYRNDDYLPAVWLARSSGMVKLAPDDWSLLLDFPLSRHVQRIAIDEQTGRVWLYGSRLLQAYTAGGNHLLGVSVPQRVDHPLDMELAVDSAAGAVWLAQYRTLHRFNQSGVREFARDLPEPVKDMSVDPQAGRLYYLADSAVYVLDEAGELIQEIQVAEGTAEAVAWDSANQYLWVATSEKVKAYSLEGSLVLNEQMPGVLFIAADGRGSVWLASATRLHRMHGSGLVELSISPLQAMPPDRITQLIVDRSDGSLWVGGVRGLSHVDENGLVEAEILLQDLHGRGPAKDVAHYVDTVAPEITIRSPADGAYLASLSPDLSIDAEDAAIGVDPASLEVLANHVPAPMACQVESSGVPMRLVCVPESPLTEGPVYLEVSLADYQGNRSATANVLFHVDITPPSIVIESPMEGAWVNQSEQRVVGYLDEAGDSSSSRLQRVSRLGLAPISRAT